MTLPSCSLSLTWTDIPRFAQQAASTAIRNSMKTHWAVSREPVQAREGRRVGLVQVKQPFTSDGPFIDAPRGSHLVEHKPKLGGTTDDQQQMGAGR